MSKINLGNANYRLEVNGAKEALDQLNELERKLQEVKKLIQEINLIGIKLNFVEEQALKEQV